MNLIANLNIIVLRLIEYRSSAPLKQLDAVLPKPVQPFPGRCMCERRIEGYIDSGIVCITTEDCVWYLPLVQIKLVFCFTHLSAEKSAASSSSHHTTLALCVDTLQWSSVAARLHRYAFTGVLLRVADATYQSPCICCPGTKHDGSSSFCGDTCLGTL